MMTKKPLPNFTLDLATASIKTIMDITSSLLVQERYLLAEEILEHAAAKYPTNVQINNSYAVSLIARGDEKNNHKALEILTHMVSIAEKPDDLISILTNRAQLLHSQNKLPEALADLNKVKSYLIQFKRPRSQFLETERLKRAVEKTQSEQEAIRIKTETNIKKHGAKKKKESKPESAATTTLPENKEPAAQIFVLTPTQDRLEVKDSTSINTRRITHEIDLAKARTPSSEELLTNILLEIENAHSSRNTDAIDSAFDRLKRYCSRISALNITEDNSTEIMIEKLTLVARALRPSPQRDIARSIFGVLHFLGAGVKQDLNLANQILHSLAIKENVPGRFFRAHHMITSLDKIRERAPSKLLIDTLKEICESDLTPRTLP